MHSTSNFNYIMVILWTALEYLNENPRHYIILFVNSLYLLKIDLEKYVTKIALSHPKISNRYFLISLHIHEYSHFPSCLIIFFLLVGFLCFLLSVCLSLQLGHTQHLIYVSCRLPSFFKLCYRKFQMYIER